MPDNIVKNQTPPPLTKSLSKFVLFKKNIELLIKRILKQNYVFSFLNKLKELGVKF